MAWPAPGATEVPTNTPIVILRNAYPPAVDVVEYTVTRLPDGSTADVSVVRTLVMNNTCAGEAVFLRPSAPLDPGARYAVRFTFQGAPLAPATDTPSEFDVGSGPSVLPPIEIEATHVRSDTRCDSNGGACSEVAEMLVRASQPLGVPHFMVFKGDGPPYESQNALRAFPGDDSWNPSIRIWSTNPCVSFDFIDVRGESVRAFTSCQASKCAMSVPAVGDSCGGRYGAGFDFWNTVPEGQECTTVIPPAEAGPPPTGFFPLQPDEDAGSNLANAPRPLAEQGDEGGRYTGCIGCAVPKQRGPRAPALAVLGAVTLLAMRRRRRA